MKILQTIITVALLCTSGTALWFAQGLKKQRMDIVQHQEVLATALKELAEHAGVDMPLPRPGFDRTPLREVLVTYKNLHGELAFNDKEVKRLNETTESAVQARQVAENSLQHLQDALKQATTAAEEQSELNTTLKTQRDAALMEVQSLQKKNHALVQEMQALEKAGFQLAAEPPSPPPVQAATAGSEWTDPPPPRDTSALIMSVNTDWEFIVLDAGRDKNFQVGHRVLFNGLDGQPIIARITKVESNLSVADVARDRIGQAATGQSVQVR